MLRVCILFATVAASLMPTAARAGEAGRGPAEGTVSLARHHTSNALDAPLALADFYTLLRGTVGRTIEHERGATRIEGSVEGRRFDTVSIENDIAFQISSSTTVRATEGVELRGTLSVSTIDEGEEFDIGGLLLGKRTRKSSFAASLQAGIQVQPDVTLVLEGSATRLHASDARFQDDLIDPIRIDPVRDRFQFGATLTRTIADMHVGAHVGALLVQSQSAALMPAFTLAQYTARAQAARQVSNGISAAVSAGFEAIRIAEAGFTQIRPALQAALDVPFASTFSLRGALVVGYDSVRTDDPIVSWVRRAEVELGWVLHPRFRIGAGAFGEMRDNIGLGSRENARGAFALARWQASAAVSVLFRIDASIRRDMTFGLDRRRLDMGVTVARAL